MSDYSFDSLETCDEGHTKVPQESACMEEAFRHIFTSCDTENQKRVRVSKLIDFIAPFMPQNADEIMDLKLALDPNNTDVSIDSETFYSVITEWTAKFEMSTSLENSFCSTVSSKNFEGMDKGAFMQSTPRPSLDKKHIKEFEPDFILNLSVASLHGDANTSKDVAAIIEKYKELEYCNKKLVDELNHNRALLIATDENIEQIDTLNKEVKKLKSQLLQEQQAKEKLQAAFKDVEDVTEGISRAEAQIVKFQKEVALLNRDNGSLSETIKDLQTENKKLEIKYQMFKSKSTEMEKINCELEIAVSIQQEKIELLEKSNINLKSTITEKQDEVDQFSNIIQCMEVEKQQLNNLLKTSRDLISHNTKSTTSTGTPGIDDTSEAAIGSTNNSFMDDSAQEFLLWKERLSSVGSVHLPHESLQDELDKVRSSEQRVESPISFRHYEEQILDLQEMLGDKQNIIDSLTKEIAEKTENINKLEESLLFCGTTCNEQINNLSTQILGLSERSSKLESLILEKERNLENLQLLLNEQIQKTEAKDFELKEQAFKISKTKLNLEKLETEVRTLDQVETENQQLLNEIKTLEKTNASVQESLDNVQAENNKLILEFWKAQKKIEDQTSCGMCEALKIKNNELLAKIVSLEERSSKKRFEKLQTSKDKLMSKYEDLEEQIKHENLRYERVVAEKVALVLKHTQEVKKLKNELNDVARLAEYGRCHNAEEIDLLEQHNRLLEEKLIQAEREKNNLVETHNLETVAREQEKANMLKQLVELESKFNKACNAMERSEEELITTTNLLAATQVVVDGTGDSPNTAFGVVTLEEIKQMKSKETLLQQVLSQLFFCWKAELEALPNASHFVPMLLDYEKACITCSVDAGMTQTRNINHLMHLSIDTFSAFCQMKDQSSLSSTLDVGVQTLSPQGSWFLYDSPDSPSEAAGFNCAMNIEDTHHTKDMDVTQALTNYDNITAFNVHTNSNIEVDNISKTLSELELSATVDNLLVTSITNATTLENIFRQKENIKEELVGQFHVEIRKLLVIFKNLQELCREVAVHDSITHCLQQLDNIVRLSLRLANLAAQCGALQEEQRSSSSTNLLIKYTLMLKQKLEQPLSHQLSINTNQVCTNEPTGVARQLSQLQTIERFDMEEEVANEVTAKIVPFSSHRSSDTRKQLSKFSGGGNTPIRTCISLMCKVLSALSILFLALFLFIIYERYDDLRYLPWDRLLSPYVKFTRRGPPPV